MSNFVHDIYPKAGYRSDHSIVITELSLNLFKRGLGIWKFNVRLLKDIEYVTKVKEIIRNVKRQYAVCIYSKENLAYIPNDEIQFVINDSLFFETFLMEIRGMSISHASYRKKQNDNREQQLIEKITEIENKLSHMINTPLYEEKNLN